MSEGDSIQKFKELTDQFQSFRAYIDKAESQRSSFRPEVVQKVIESYEAKSQAILEQLIPLQSDIEARITSLDGSLAEAERLIEGARLEIEEVELRALIGELSEADKDARVAELEVTRAEQGAIRDEVSEELSTLRELMARIAPPQEKPAPPKVEAKPKPKPAPVAPTPPPPTKPAPPSPPASSGVRVKLRAHAEPEPEFEEEEDYEESGFDSDFGADQDYASEESKGFDGGFDDGFDSPEGDYDPYGQSGSELGGDSGPEDNVASGFEDLADFGTSLDERELDGLGSEDGGSSLMEMVNFLEELPMGESPKDLPELGNPDGPGGLGEFPELGSDWQNALGDDFGDAGGASAQIQTAASQRRGYLIRAEGTDHEEYYEVSEEVLTLGRGRDNAIQIKEDTKVSRYHCRLFKEGSNFYAEDNNSSNGTLVNGELISKRMLEGGEEVSIGETFFRFTIR